MTSPPPNVDRLRLVNDDGEIVHGAPSYEDLQTIVEELKSKLAGSALQIGNLKRELRDLQGLEPEAGSVRIVLDYWARRVKEEGWWSKLPTFKPGSNRWSAVRGRLKDDWTSEQLCEAVEGALHSLGQRAPRPPRAWADATSIFRNEENCSRNFEAAHDPRLERVKAMRELPVEVQRMIERDNLRPFLARCLCGHLMLAHAPPDARALRVCVHPECLVQGEDGCGDFEELAAAVAGARARWLEKRGRGEATA